ncbi:MAG: hypothetical protein ABSG53_22675, partial [Thermoguttaceae bacterium]
MTAIWRRVSSVIVVVPLLALAVAPIAAQALGDPNKDRYKPRDPLSLTLPQRTATRKDYVEFVRPFAKDYLMRPEADQWQWRHGPLRLLPPLAVFALEGDPAL